ncbi:hypothetical protein EXS57_02760 [Candidatus Kaiserbacteria bacterium]|nr:hypothetical protein [Candidatus Kaiserbacteria bacterium]
MRAKQWQQGFLIGILVLVACWLVFLIWGLIEKAQVAVTKASEVKGQYQVLEERKAVLEATVAALETERGRDAAIRTAFGVARSGEEVIVVMPLVVATATPPLSWWQKVLSLF